MSILMPDVQLFVVVGEDLKVELEASEIFCGYFQYRREQLRFLDDIDKFDEQILNNSDYHDKQTLFIIRHFDLDVDSINENNNQIESLATEFNKLVSHKCCIMGYIALLQSIQMLKSIEEPIKMVQPDKPLHSLAMHDALITFSGISNKLEAEQLLKLTRYMGAKSRGEVTNKTTHLVAGNTRGIKYRKAQEQGSHIMSTEWVRESYRLSQNNINFDANKIVKRYKLKIFDGLHMAFVGFKDEDLAELCDLTKSNDGQVVDADNLACTHIIVDAIKGCHNSDIDLNTINRLSNAYVVYKEWFWASIEMEGKVSEDAYAIAGFRSETRRLSKIRRTSFTGNQSLGNILSPKLDYSRSPESFIQERLETEVPSVSKDLFNAKTKITKRHEVCLELLTTERNYVKVLDTIMTLFKAPLENSTSEDPILPMEDVKTIFGSLTPIHKAHNDMLRDLEKEIELNWKETNRIGKVLFENSIHLLEAYRTFMNFFEETKQTITACEKKYPRFHAFLKRCQSKIECNRESLIDMFIRPVQRIPSIKIIITRLVEETDESNPDKKYLLEALDSICLVLNLINEHKRTTEHHKTILDIFHNIEDCPPNLLSATRRFICSVEARLLFLNNESEIIPSKSHKVVLFLFSDLIEICKIRSMRKSYSTRGPRPIRRTTLIGGNLNGSSHITKKEHRHLDDLRLCDIKQIFKKCQSPEMTDAIVIQATANQKYDRNYRYYPLLIDDAKQTKVTFVDRLEECIAKCDSLEQMSEYSSKEMPVISNDEIDFGYANSLVRIMEKSSLSRVFSFSQALLSPSLKSQRNISRINSRIF